MYPLRIFRSGPKPNASRKLGWPFRLAELEADIVDRSQESVGSPSEGHPRLCRTWHTSVAVGHFVVFFLGFSALQVGVSRHRCGKSCRSVKSGRGLARSKPRLQYHRLPRLLDGLMHDVLRTYCLPKSGSSLSCFARCDEKIVHPSQPLH